MQITETTTVAELAAAIPSSVRVFQRLGIDFCCGGKKPLAEACRERGVSADEVIREIDAAQRTAPGVERDWQQEPLEALISHIVTAYHNPLRAELPRLTAMASKVSSVHGAKARELARIEGIVAELADDLLS